MGEEGGRRLHQQSGRKKKEKKQNKNEKGSIMQNVFDYILCSVIAGRPNSVTPPRD